MTLYGKLLVEKAGLYEGSSEIEDARDDPATFGCEQSQGLYGKLLFERLEEERRRARPLGTFYGLDSVALEEAMRRRPGCRGDLYKLYRYIHEGVGGFAAGMWFGNLRNKYPEEYQMMKAERNGEFYEQQRMVTMG